MIEDPHPIHRGSGRPPRRKTIIVQPAKPDAIPQRLWDAARLTQVVPMGDVIERMGIPGAVLYPVMQVARPQSICVETPAFSPVFGNVRRKE